MSSKIISLLLIYFFPLSIFAQDNPWIPKKVKDDIEVYYRNPSDSDVKELKMVFTVDANLSSIVALLNDLENYYNWVYKLSEVSLVERVNDQEMYYYNRMDFPWPLSDRDLIAHSKITQDPVTKHVTSRSISAHYKMPEKEDIVRISLLEIIWNLEPLKNGKTKINYFLKSDPAGNIPSWMVNLALDQGPLKTVEWMRRELRKEKFKNKKLAYIND